MDPYSRPIEDAWNDNRIRRSLRDNSAEDIAASMVDYEVARGEYEGCSTELELAYIAHLDRIRAITSAMRHESPRPIPGGPFGSPRRSHASGPHARRNPYSTE